MAITACQFIYGEKDKTCKSCLKPLKTTEAFLRHVSHKELCLSFYGEDFIQAVRNESRKESKRKWAEANEELVKAKTPKKSYYVPNKVKFSETGRAFGRVFRSVFNPRPRLNCSNIFQHIPTYSNIFQHIPTSLKYSNKSKLYVPNRPKVFQQA